MLLGPWSPVCAPSAARRRPDPPYRVWTKSCSTRVPAKCRAPLPQTALWRGQQSSPQPEPLSRRGPTRQAALFHPRPVRGTQGAASVQFFPEFDRQSLSRLLALHRLWRQRQSKRSGGLQRALTGCGGTWSRGPLPWQRCSYRPVGARQSLPLACQFPYKIEQRRPLGYLYGLGKGCSP
jgi:hypothetical protein